MTLEIEILESAGKVCTDPALMCWFETHPGVATWAQLVGVVFALAGTLLAAWMPIIHSHRNQRLDRIRQLQSAVQAAILGEGVVNVFTVAIESMPALLTPGLVNEHSAMVLARLESVAGMPTDTPEVSQYLMLITTAVRGAREAALQGPAAAWNVEKVKAVLAVAKDWQDSATRYREEICRLAEAAGCKPAMMIGQGQELDQPSDGSGLKPPRKPGEPNASEPPQRGSGPSPASDHASR